MRLYINTASLCFVHYAYMNYYYTYILFNNIMSFKMYSNSYILMMKKTDIIHTCLFY